MPKKYIKTDKNINTNYTDNENNMRSTTNINSISIKNDIIKESKK